MQKCDTVHCDGFAAKSVHIIKLVLNGLHRQALSYKSRQDVYAEFVSAEKNFSLIGEGGENGL